MTTRKLRRGVSRRSLLGGAGAGILGGLSGLWGAQLGATAAPLVASEDEPRDYSTRATYDWFINSITPVSDLPRTFPADEAGFWTWQQSALMRTYPMAYRAWGDPHYLNKLIIDADLLLSERDTERGVVDWSGKSLPAWRHAYNWTAGSVDVPDAQGKPLLRLRIGVSPGPKNGKRGVATLTHDATPGRFTIVAVRESDKRETDTFTNLSLDPASPDYIVNRLYWAEPNLNRITALDLRTNPHDEVLPLVGEYLMTADFSYGYVDTGVIIQPLADFAATVMADRRLWHRPISAPRPGARPLTYRDKAEEYIAAAEAALGVHDHAWRDNSDGEGWYVILPEHPSSWAGSDLPHNQNLAIAKAYLLLANATNDSAHRDRAEALLRRFKNDITKNDSPNTPPDDLPPFRWSYTDPSGLFYRGWTREDHVSNRIPYSRGYKVLEDISHATLDIAAAATGTRNGLVFTAADMRRFARTFNEKIVKLDKDGKTIFSLDVAGAGTTGDLGLAGDWARLGPWNQQVYDTALAVYNDNFQDLTPQRAQYAESVGVLATRSDA